jgi:hypothetical protein
MKASELSKIIQNADDETLGEFLDGQVLGRLPEGKTVIFLNHDQHEIRGRVIRPTDVGVLLRLEDGSTYHVKFES